MSTTAKFQPLSPLTDYSIASTDDQMDEVSLRSSSHHHHTTKKNTSMSSGASISSKFSRASRRAADNSVKNSELGVPLTSSTSLDDDDGEDEGNGSESIGDWEGASSSISSPISSPTSTATTKSYISEDDPFYLFRSDLTKKISSVDTELNNYLNIVQTTDTAVNTHQIKETKKQLKRHIKHAESTLNDLETTVRVVDKQRHKFPHINDIELTDRKEFVNEAKDRIATAKLDMISDVVRDKFVSDERALNERRRRDGGNGSSNGVSSANGTFANNGYAKASSDIESGNSSTSTSANNPERAETVLMMQQQDETLDDLDLAVTRVGYMAETIHEEIDTQNVMLKNLEEDLADAEEQLGVVMGKLAKLLKTKNKCQIGLIIILSLIVLLLFFLVIYT